MDGSSIKRSTRSTIQQQQPLQSEQQESQQQQQQQQPQSSVSSCDLNPTSSSSASTSSASSSTYSLDSKSKPTKTNSFFRLLISEANAMPIHDFQLSPSFLKRTRSNKLLSGLSDSESQGSTFEIIQPANNSMSQFIVLDRNEFLQTNSQGKQATIDAGIQFKNGIKLERTNFIAAGLNASELGSPRLRPIQKEYLDDKFYKFNDGLIELKCASGSIDEYLERARKRMECNKKTYRKVNVNSLLSRTQKRTQSVIENETNRNVVETDTQSTMMTEASSGSRKLNAIKNRYQIEMTDDENDQDSVRSEARCDENGDWSDLKFGSLKAVNSDRIVKLYTLSIVPSVYSLETQLLILVQHHYINIWFQIDKSNWKSCVLSAKKNEKIFTTELVRFSDVICLFCLATDMQSVYLKYCKIDLQAQNASFLSIETFKNISINQFDFINLGQISDDKIAISIPKSKENKVDLYSYHLVMEEGNLKSLKKNLLHTYELTSRCRTNCVFMIRELKDHFVCLLDQTLHIWNIENNTFKSLSLEKHVSPSITFFDSFHDKGLLYLLSGNKYTSQIKTLVINLERNQISKLSTYELNESSSDDKEAKSSLSSALANEIKLFKRCNDQLILIKRDSTLVVFDIINTEIVFKKQLRSLHDACIGCLNGDAVIFAACGRQSIINVFN